MINHVRTLLLNHGREGHGLTEPGEEYIPADYVPRALNSPLSLVRATLFGNNPDRLFLSYRMRQLMQLLHATPLVADVSAEDPRITYLPFKDDLFDTAFRTTITQTAGTPHRFEVVGSHLSNMSMGLSKQVWDVTVDDGGEIRVTKRRGIMETNYFTLTGDTLVPLAGSNLQLFLHNAPAGCRLTIESLARPEMDVATVLNGTATAIGQYGFDDIFPLMVGEPVATWKRIWEDHPDSVMKFAAMLLAIAFRTAQMPQEARGV